jgi:hypothetical protein
MKKKIDYLNVLGFFYYAIPILWLIFAIYLKVTKQYVFSEEADKARIETNRQSDKNNWEDSDDRNRGGDYHDPFL